MGLISDFFIAAETPIPTYAGGEEFDANDRCQFNGISPLEAAAILAILRGVENTVELIDEFPLISPEDAQDWTMSVPADMVTLLAALDEASIAEATQALAEATEEELGWTSDDFVPVVSGLRQLAGRANQDGKRMYLWNSL